MGEQQEVPVHGQGRPFPPCGNVFLPEVAEGDDPRSNGDMVAIADLEGGVAKIR